MVLISATQRTGINYSGARTDFSVVGVMDSDPGQTSLLNLL